MSLRNFLSITFPVVLGDVIAEALPAVAAEADMFETIDITTLEAGGLTYGDVAESSPIIKEPAPVSGGKRRRPLRMTFCEGREGGVLIPFPRK